jgi:flagellar hook-associated protein 1 FlgK
MSGLLSSLRSTAGALRVFERALTVTQNNVSNASTPGYAVQRLSLQAADFEPSLGLLGGVRAGEVQSARSQYAEQAVRRQLESLGYFDQKAATVASIEITFDISGESGIPGALNQLFQSFSAWSLAPNSTTARHEVMERARELAESFQQTAASLATASDRVDRQLRQTVEEINQLGARVLDYNLAIRRGDRHDAGLDANLHATLEQLSELVDFDTIFSADGSVSVLLGGQTPLVIGDHQYPVGLSLYSPAAPPPVYPDGPPAANLIGHDGREITAQISGGRLGALLDVRNRFLPSLRGDAYQAGGLNLLAKGLADCVNQILTTGLVSDGPPPETGVPLFAYDTVNGTNVARSLTLNAGITPAMLAPIAPGPPYVSNGTALRLAGLANPQDNADKIDGFSFIAYYGNLAARVGHEAAGARENKDFRTQAVAQVRSLRSEVSGVSLDEEAVLMIEFQRAYQAAARMVNVLNELTETAVNLYR